MSSTRMEHMMPTVRLMRVAIISRTAKSRPSLSVPQMWGEHLLPRLDALEFGLAVLKGGEVLAVLDLLVVGIGPKAGQDVGKESGGS